MTATREHKASSGHQLQPHERTWEDAGIRLILENPCFHLQFISFPPFGACRRPNNGLASCLLRPRLTIRVAAPPRKTRHDRFDSPRQPRKRSVGADSGFAGSTGTSPSTRGTRFPARHHDSHAAIGESLHHSGCRDKDVFSPLCELQHPGDTAPTSVVWSDQ
jgi:hypothetical protein